MRRRTKARVTGGRSGHWSRYVGDGRRAERCCGTSGSFGTRVTGQGESNAARHAPTGRGPGFCLQTPSLLSRLASPSLLFGEAAQESGPSSSTKSPQTLWTLCWYGRMQRSPLLGLRNLGTIVAVSLRGERKWHHRELPLPGSRRPSLLFMRGIRNLRTSHRSHTSQPLFRLEQRLHRWRCSKPLCFQNRSPPLTPFGPAQRPAIIHQTTKPPITLTARPRSRPHSPSSHPQT